MTSNYAWKSNDIKLCMEEEQLKRIYFLFFKPKMSKMATLGRKMPFKSCYFYNNTIYKKISFRTGSKFCTKANYTVVDKGKNSIYSLLKGIFNNDHFFFNLVFVQLSYNF